MSEHSAVSEFMEEFEKFYVLFETFSKKWMHRYDTEIEPHLTEEQRERLEFLVSQGERLTRNQSE